MSAQQGTVEHSHRNFTVSRYGHRLIVVIVMRSEKL